MALSMIIYMSATCRNKKSYNYTLKGERSEPKIFVFFRRKHEVLFNISVQYVIVLDHFVPTKFQMYRQIPKCTDKTTK